MPVCVAFAPVIFPSSELIIAENANDAEVTRVVREATRIATEQYKVIRERKSMLPECVVLMEVVGRVMWYVFLFMHWGLLANVWSRIGTQNSSGQLVYRRRRRALNL